MRQRPGSGGGGDAHGSPSRSSRALRRRRATSAPLRTPVGNGDRATRRRNVRGAFAVDSRHADALAGRELVIVDDVMTSGSTLDAAAQELKRAGAQRVVAAVVARTP